MGRERQQRACHKRITKNIYDKIMQNSRRHVKFNYLRHPKDAFYSYHTFKVLFSRLNRAGSGGKGFRHFERALQGCKLHVQAPPLWVTTCVLRTLWLPLKLAAKRTGGNVSIVPLPVRRDKKNVIARTLLTHVVYIAKYRRRLDDELKKEILAIWNNLRSSESLREKNNMISLINEHRTEMHLRWR